MVYVQYITPRKKKRIFFFAFLTYQARYPSYGKGAFFWFPESNMNIEALPTEGEGSRHDTNL